jgi:Exo-beta-D-glucosaminidase Ig-fold domain
LRCDRDGYDLRVRMHRDANLNMIRNWVGMVGREEFYQACDRYGVLIWDDFWLANPGDGPDPTDHEMFLRKARDKVLRFRHHASLALYCGRNEGLPPADLDQGMRNATEQLDGTRFYLPASDRGLVTGHGPYENQDPEWYFANRGATFHSEQGIVCVPPVESMRSMMPEEDLWPISNMWAVHDYQEPRSPLYTQRIEQRYGKPLGIEDYCRKSQLVNLESARAIFECLQSRQGGGQLLWMSQSAWPCLICQLYDYYFEQTAAFFGAKTACEPVHILWDQASNLIKVANNTITDQAGLRAEARVYDFDGREQWHQAKSLTVPATSTMDCFPLSIPSHLDRVRFIRLQLVQGRTVLSTNFYWSSATPGDYTALNTLKELNLSLTVHADLTENQHTITATVTNPNPTVALAVRLMLVHGKSNERVLPTFHEDNYFSLLPQEKRAVRIQVANEVLRGEMPRLSVTGWNVKPFSMMTELRSGSHRQV